MSFIYHYFYNENSTSAEKENAATLKTIIKEHKTILKAESQQYEHEYKQALKNAEEEYKRAKQQAKENMHRSLLDAVKREMDAIMATEEFANSDAKTKTKIEGFKTWMAGASVSLNDDEILPSYPAEKESYIVAA
ncbi:hypothetical protein BGX27_005079 [Mortierella sp. AM989]|nr:hypothetical protein BGX27_005079 [Mortierella sp. AM989]